MIKIYLFITGLFVLLEPTGQQPIRIAFAAGDYHHEGLGDIVSHTTQLVSGPDQNSTHNLTKKPYFLSIKQGETTRWHGIEGSKHLADFSEIACLEAADTPDEDPVEIEARAACFDPQEAAVGCPTQTGTPSPAVAGILELHGDWSAATRTDCEGTWPKPVQEALEVGFVDARNAARGLVKKTSPFRFSNSLVLETEVSEQEFSEQALGGDWPAGVFFVGSGEPELIKNKEENCETQPGYLASEAKGCVMVSLRHGPETLGNKKFGPGDIHFAALYNFLETKPRTLWLPFRIRGSVCPEAGGTIGLDKCIGGFVKPKDCE